MAHKPYAYNVMSAKKCACGKLIKANVLYRQPAANMCYKCYRKANGRLLR